MSKIIDLGINKSNPNFYLVTIHFNSDEGKVNSAEIQNLIIMLENFFKNCENQNLKFVQHFDIVKLKHITLPQILDFCSFFKRNRDLFINHCLCTTATIGEGIAKRFFNLFLSYYDPVRPISLVKNNDEAMKFGQECFDGQHDNSSIIM